MTDEEKKLNRWKKEIELLEHYSKFFLKYLDVKIGISCFIYDYDVEYNGKTY